MEQGANLPFYSKGTTHLTSLKIFHYTYDNFQGLRNGSQSRRVVRSIEIDIDPLTGCLEPCFSELYWCHFEPVLMVSHKHMLPPQFRNADVLHHLLHKGQHLHEAHLRQVSTDMMPNGRPRKPGLRESQEAEGSLKPQWRAHQYASQAGLDFFYCAP